MARYHLTADGPIPFTPGEEAEWDATEAAWVAQKSIEAHNKPLLFDIATAENATGFSRRQREYLIANSAPGALKTALSAVDAVIAAKRALLR